MKKSLYRRLAAAGTVLLLSAFPVYSASAATFSGSLESVSENRIAGWAWDEENPQTPVAVELTLNGEGGPGDCSFITLTAGKARPDLKSILDSSNHGFSFLTNWEDYAGDTFMVTAAVVSGDDRIPLDGSFTYKKGEAEGTAANPQETKQSSKYSNVIAVIGEGGPGFLNTQNTKTAAKTEEQSTAVSTAQAEETGEKGEFLGSFTASGYCGCEICSGGNHLTYAGTVPQANHTIAANLERFPLGTKLWINGVVYTVEDTGSGVDANRLDIYFDTHEEALAFGLQTVEVYAVVPAAE